MSSIRDFVTSTLAKALLQVVEGLQAAEGFVALGLLWPLVMASDHLFVGLLEMVDLTLLASVLAENGGERPDPAQVSVLELAEVRHRAQYLRRVLFLW